MCQAIGNTWSTYRRPCGGLQWEQEYRLNDKYMCKESSVWSGCTNENELYCPYWSSVSWATCQNKGKTAFLQMSVAMPTAKEGPVILLTSPSWTQGNLKGGQDARLVYLSMDKAQSPEPCCYSRGSQSHSKPHLMRSFIPFMKK